MKASHLCALLMAFAATVIVAAPVSAQSNSVFAFGIGGTHPILWKDYKPLQDNAFACDKDNAQQTSTCKEVGAKLIRVLSDAFLQAVMVNVGTPPKDRFCDDYTTKLVESKNVNGMAAYAILLIDDRLKHGSALYGEELPETYVGKIVFDALRAQSPCTK